MVNVAAGMELAVCPALSFLHDVCSKVIVPDVSKLSCTPIPVLSTKALYSSRALSAIKPRT